MFQNLFNYICTLLSNYKDLIKLIKLIKLIMDPLFISVETKQPGGKSPQQVKQQYDVVLDNLEKIPNYITKHMNSRKIVIISGNTDLPLKTIPFYTQNDILNI